MPPFEPKPLDVYADLSRALQRFATEASEAARQAVRDEMKAQS